MQTEAKLQTVTDFGGETNYSLIEYMALADEDATGAWSEFYIRHAPYLFGRLKKAYFGTFDATSIEDLVANTFIKVKNGAHTFKPIPDLNVDEQLYHVLGWLGTIARNIINSDFKKQEGLELVYPDETDEEGNDGWNAISFAKYRHNESSYNGHSKVRDPRLQLIGSAFETLSENEKYVLSVTLENVLPGREHQRLPNKISRQLAEALNTTTVNIRQIRHRAMNKIKNIIDRELEKSQ